MKAARISAPKQFEFLDVDVPKIEDGRCLVRLERWSVCGSDIRAMYGPVRPEEDYPFPIGSHCHEAAGVVVESKTDRFHDGQRVIVLPNTDGTGCFVEYIDGDPNRMIALPDEGDLSEWVMCQPSGTVLHAVQRIGTILGKRVLVMGQGAIGLSFTAMCARSGAKQIIAVDPLGYRLEYSKRFGATDIVNPSEDPLDDAVRELTRGEMPDITIEAGGYPDTLNAALRLVREFGKVLIFGFTEGHGADGHTVPVQENFLLRRQATILPTAPMATDDPVSHIKNMVDLRVRGWFDPAEMITHRMKFDDVKRAFDMYENHEDSVVKVVMS